MTSIVFTSLFLGLIVGPQTVGVFVDGPASAVEYRLDGKPLGRVHRPPWELRVDLGAELSPHELVATAIDHEGREVASARQWLNLPRQDAETEVVLERNRNGRPVGARLSWHSIVGSKPRALSATFDGTRPGEDPRSFGTARVPGGAALARGRCPRRRLRRRGEDRAHGDRRPAR